MKTASFTCGAVALAISVLAVPTRTEAQQPENDRFDIYVSRPVTVGDKVLQPGAYSVKPLSIAGGDTPVLSISDASGIRLEASAMTAPAVENRIQPETRVTLRRIGHQYYFDKIWVRGQAYGYSFPLPKGEKAHAGQVP